MWVPILSGFMCFLWVNAQYNAVPARCLFIIQRSEWQAQLAKRIEYVVTPLQKVVVYRTHQTECRDIESCKVKMGHLQNIHMHHLGFNDIGYNFVIAGDGNVYEGTGWAKKSTVDDDTVLSIAIIGSTNDSLNQQHMELFNRLIKCAIDLGDLSKNYTLHEEGRGNVPPIACSQIIEREKWSQRLTYKIARTQQNFDCYYSRYLSNYTCNDRSTCIKMLARLQDKYLDEKNIGIPFHFLIDGDGTVYEGLGWNRRALIMYDQCIDIILFGDNPGTMNYNQRIGHNRILQCATDLDLYIGVT